MDQVEKDKAMAKTSDEIRRLFSMLTEAEQLEFIEFQETLFGLKAGETCELKNCLFIRETDGTYSVLMPKPVIEAYKTTFNRSPGDEG